MVLGQSRKEYFSIRNLEGRKIISSFFVLKTQYSESLKQNQVSTRKQKSILLRLSIDIFPYISIFQLYIQVLLYLNQRLNIYFLMQVFSVSDCFTVYYSLQTRKILFRPFLNYKIVKKSKKIVLYDHSLLSKFAELC
jgi:hypothetical protein